MTRAHRYGVVALLLALAVSGCHGAAHDGTAGAADGDNAEPCRAAQIHARGLYQRSNVNAFGTILVSNRTDSTCFLRGGRPRILVMLGTRRLPTYAGGAQLNAIASPRRIMLTPGAFAFDPERGPRGVGFYLDWFPACMPEGQPTRFRVLLPGVAHSIAVSGDPGRPSCFAAPGIRVSPAYRRSTMVISRLAPSLQRAPAPF